LSGLSHGFRSTERTPQRSCAKPVSIFQGVIQARTHQLDARFPEPGFGRDDWLKSRLSSLLEGIAEKMVNKI
jgi:hypothetical protein